MSRRKLAIVSVAAFALSLGCSAAHAQKTYWTDLYGSRIQSGNLDGSHVEDLVSTGLGAVRGIALDVPLPGDCDLDGIVSLDDHELFITCLTDRDVEPLEECQRADLDDDGNVDLADFTAFQTLFTGP